ncbi:hypothetical protein TSOC_012247, partial [Tetrabaena socialis]
LCHFYRLLHVEGAVRRHWARLKAADPRATVTQDDVRALIPEHLARTLGAAAEALDGLRRRSQWHWVHLGRLFAPLVQQQPAAAAGVGQGAEKAGAGQGAGARVPPPGISAVRGMVA